MSGYIREMTGRTDVCSTLCRFDPRVPHPGESFSFSRFKVHLKQCLVQISGYSALFTCVEDLRKEVYDSENEEHERMLLKVSYSEMVTQRWFVFNKLMWAHATHSKGIMEVRSDTSQGAGLMYDYFDLNSKCHVTNTCNK